MWYLKSAFDTYQKVQDTVQSRLGEVQSAILSPVEIMTRFLSGVPAEPVTSHNAGSESELDTLRKRVAELEARLTPEPRGKAVEDAKRKNRSSRRSA